MAKLGFKELVPDPQVCQNTFLTIIWCLLSLDSMTTCRLAISSLASTTQVTPTSPLKPFTQLWENEVTYCIQSLTKCFLRSGHLSGKSYRCIVFSNWQHWEPGGRGHGNPAYSHPGCALWDGQWAYLPQCHSRKLIWLLDFVIFLKIYIITVLNLVWYFIDEDWDENDHGESNEANCEDENPGLDHLVVLQCCHRLPLCECAKLWNKLKRSPSPPCCTGRKSGKGDWQQSRCQDHSSHTFPITVRGSEQRRGRCLDVLVYLWQH